MTEIKFIDLQAQQNKIRSKVDRAIKRVLDHGKYIMGPEVTVLEERLAEFVGVKHCISTSSGTDALLMALMASGVGSGDAIFTTPFTFIATSEVISLLGATPVFVDIDPRTFNMDPQKLDEAITTYNLPLTPKGIIPVDLFGLPADYDEINSIACKHDLFVLEDTAQGFGSVYKGRKAGSLADVATTSFFPAKPLGCYGDGGAIFTDDDVLADILCSIRVHGKGGNKYDNVRTGVNGRLDTLQAAILLSKLDIFPNELMFRQSVADTYTSLLADASEIITPYVPDGNKSSWAQYSIVVDDRVGLQMKLGDAGIPSAIYYPVPLHLQAAYADLGYVPGDFPVAEGVTKRILSLPMHPYLEKDQQEYIVSVIKNLFR